MCHWIALALCPVGDLLNALEAVKPPSSTMLSWASSGPGGPHRDGEVLLKPPQCTWDHVQPTALTPLVLPN